MFDIRELFLFRGLPDTAKEAVCASFSEPKHFARGDVIYSQGEFERSLGIFLSGGGSAKAENTVKTFFSPGSVFGAAAIFGNSDIYISEIVAARDSLVLFITEKELRDIIRTYPVCAENYIVFLSDKVRFLNRKIAQYTGCDAKAKLLRIIEDGASDEGVFEIRNMASLAKSLGIGRTSLYRALSELENSGTVRRDGAVIYILY